MSEWVVYENADAGFAMDLPASWDVFEEVGDALAVFRAPIEDPDAFLANLNVVIIEDEEMGQDLDRFTEAVVRQHQRTLTDVLMLDIEESTMAGQPARRVLCCYRQGVFSVTLEQWWTLADNGVVVLSGSAGSLDYPVFRDVFDRMVSSFSVIEGA